MENKMVVAVKAIIVYDNKILLVRRSAEDDIGANTWECVGGKIEFGETLEEALLREVQEEVNLVITIKKLLYATTFKTDEFRQVTVLAYLCTANGKALTLSGEHESYLWADKKQAMSLLSEPIINDFDRNSVWTSIFADPS